MPLLCFYTIHRTKLVPRLVKCVFLGYSIRKKGYKLLALDTGKVFVSRNVVSMRMPFHFLQEIMSISFLSTHKYPILTNLPQLCFLTMLFSHLQALRRFFQLLLRTFLIYFLLVHLLLSIHLAPTITIHQLKPFPLLAQVIH